jgi:hypothetical protein
MEPITMIVPPQRLPSSHSCRVCASHSANDKFAGLGPSQIAAG